MTAFELLINTEFMRNKYFFKVMIKKILIKDVAF